MIQPIRVAINFNTPNNNTYKAVSELESSEIKVEDIVTHIMKNLIVTDNIPKDYFVDCELNQKYLGQSLKDGDNIYIRIDQQMFEGWLSPLKKAQVRVSKNNFKNQKDLEETAQTRNGDQNREDSRKETIQVRQYNQQADIPIKQANVQGNEHLGVQYKNYIQLVQEKQIEKNQSFTISNQKSPKNQSKIFLPPIKASNDQNQPTLQNQRNIIAHRDRDNRDLNSQVRHSDQALSLKQKQQFQNNSQQNNKYQEKQLPVINSMQPNHRNLNQIQAKQKVQQESCCKVI